MNESLRRWLVVGVTAALAWTACRATVPPTPAKYEPAESLLSIVAEFQRYRNADLYRFPYPRDLSGQNVFKATLVRLGNYQTLYPKKYDELIAFTRAQTYARLGDYQTAARFCKEAQNYGGDLAAQAAEHARMLDEFSEATALSRRSESFVEYERMLEERVERCQRLVDRYSKPPWHGLARCEHEQAEVDLAEFLWANRQVIPNGPRRAFDLLEAIRDHHRESKNFYRHTLRLGDWACEMATEYATLFPPERALFIWEEFERWTAKAKNHYLEVAQSFGAEERTEAAARLAALEALEHRVRALNR